MSASSTVTEIILRAAGVPRPIHENPRKRSKRSSGSCSNKQVFYRLTSEEWGAVLRVCHGRDWRKWEREAIRTALGFKNHVWTPCADAFLRLNFRRLPPEALRAALPGRTDYAITDRAFNLGLTGACDDRFLTLREVARVVGYDAKAVAKMVKPSRVVMTRRVSKVLYRVDDVKRAVVERGEPAYVVAKRLKVTAQTVRKTLVTMGIPRPPPRHAWRISDEVVVQLKERLRR